MRTAISMLVSICLVGNLCGTSLLFEISGSDRFVQVCYGVGSGLIIGQVTLLAIWLALGVEPLVIRLPRALALSVLVLYSWLIGASLGDSRFPMEASIVVTALGMLYFSILTAPLWVIRWFSSRRVVRPDRVDVARERFTLRHLLIWTAVVAAMTALGKLIIQAQLIEGVGMPPADMLIQISIIVTIIGLFVATLGLALTWGVLAERPSWRVWLVILAMLSCGAPALHEVIYIIYGQQPSTDARVAGIVAWYGFALSALAMTAGGLFLARVLGYRYLVV